MENKSANTIIETFTAYIVQKLPFLIKENIKFQRFDELWFEAYSPDENEWVKGWRGIKVAEFGEEYG